MDLRRTLRRLPAAALASLLVVATVAEGAPARDRGPRVHVLRIVAAEPTPGEYAFELRETVPAGATRLSLVNHGREVHHAQLFRLRDGATVDELAGALATGDPAAALEFGSFDGGTSLVAPGARSRADAVVDLRPGSNALLCFVPGPEGPPHLVHGMLQPFTVTRDGDTPPVPRADLEVDLVDYGFETPAAIQRDAVLRVRNRGTVEPHEMVLSRLDRGASLAEVRDALAAGAPLPATPVGGVQALMPGATQSLRLDLAPGDYVLACEIPSPFDQVPHSRKGMIKEVTIT